jgi:transcriptional regulator with XRE-family HTH domain
MSDYDTPLDVRARLLGVLLRDARLYAGKTVKDCAEVLGITPATWNAYESGEKSPSLPELELLAYFCDVPLSHFWGTAALSEKEEQQRASLPPPAILEIRDRMIGAKLRQARQNARVKLKDFAAELGISNGALTAYEFGEKPLPLPELEVIVNRLGLAVEDVLEPTGVVGEWESEQRLFERFKQLSPELREFVAEPGNEHYLHLAQRLSQLPTQQLRAVATGLLEITY